MAALELYTKSRAAQLAQPLVDKILRADPSFAAVKGNQLILLAARKATALVTKAAARLPERP